MANLIPENANFLPEEPVWHDGIYQIEVTDDVRGGPINEGGISNLQAKQLGDRDAYLKKEMEDNTDDLQRQITSMQGRGGYLTAFDFGVANPTQQQLTDYALAQIGQTDQTLIWDRTHVKNMFNGHVWVLNNTPETDPPIFEWVDDGLDSVSVANNDGLLGIVKGGHGADDGFIASDGTIKIRVPLNADQVDGLGRNLLEVLGVSTIPEAMAEIRRRCNNNAEIDNTGIPDFGGLAVGDYLDGIDFSGTAAPTSGTAPQAWNNTYKNNRIEIAGFNTYKGMGSTENNKNHILFVFRNIIAKARMNATDTNVGGYPSSEMRIWLEGANGDGSGVLATKLKEQLGGDYLYKVNKIFPTDNGNYNWANASLFIPTELEIFGIPLYGSEGVYESGKRSGYATPVHFPIYQKSYARRIKRWNGSRDWYFEATPYSGSSATFTSVDSYGGSYGNTASAVGGCAPAFCVA